VQRKAARIGTQLDELYPNPAVPLTHETPFQLLVSVILSAQVRAAVSIIFAHHNYI
jgi:endonuclease-3